MSGVKPTALPTPRIRWAAFSSVENWLRRNYGVFAAISIVLLILNELHIGGFDLRHWDWFYVAGWVTFLLVFKAGLLLPDKLHQVLSRLTDSHVLSDKQDELGDFEQKLDRSGDRAALVGGVAVAAILAVGWAVVKRAALPHYLSSVILELALAFLAGSVIGRAVSYSTLGRQLRQPRFAIKVNPEHLDGAAGLRPVGGLYFFQSALLAVPALFLAVMWFFLPLVSTDYKIWRDVYAGLLGIIILCEVLAFVSPMWSFHNLMKEKKQELLSDADDISEQVTQVQQELRGNLSGEDQRRLEDRLGRLTQRYYAIVRMVTWPVDTGIRRWFVINNIVLIVPVATQVLSAMNASHHFLG
jgi:hypothetical protein